MDELFDLDLINLPTGEMSCSSTITAVGNVALDVTDPVVPVGQWFQIEAFYRNAQDARGRLTFWLDGRRSSTSRTSRWRRRRGSSGTRPASART